MKFSVVCEREVAELVRCTLEVEAADMAQATRVALAKCLEQGGWAHAGEPIISKAPTVHIVSEAAG